MQTFENDIYLEMKDASVKGTRTIIQNSKIARDQQFPEMM